jgi:crossover junction endodeoxyribonuclease RuvC
VRILGVDPSLYVTGYGVIETSGGILRLIEAGVLAPERGQTLSERLADLQRGILEIVKSFKPDAMVVEQVFSRGAFPRTALLMAHARGALVCSAGLCSLPVFDYAATSVKKALVGRGAATKEQVAAMVVHALCLTSTPSPEDVTDALALAIAHARRCSTDLGRGAAAR